MSLLPRLLPNGNVLVPKLVQGTDDVGNEFYGDALVEIEPTHPNYAAARAEAERFAKFVELEDEQFANTRAVNPTLTLSERRGSSRVPGRCRSRPSACWSLRWC